MEYTVFIQPHARGGFPASVPALPSCQGLGTTQDEALKRVSASIKEFLGKTQIVRLKVEINEDAAADPWDEVIGMFAQDETFDDFQNEMKRYRGASGEVGLAHKGRDNDENF
jgi:predicted RNase H-like HicB family nuclease